ncbi:MAG: maleate cis-trans isomerase [Dehalococcoidia bacterium]|nr:maleate cis-trans isomerase [Dehalococcoidia bacterium]
MVAFRQICWRRIAMGRFGKKRIGLLTPAGNTTIEDDFARWMPDSLRLHVNRLFTGSPRNPNTPEGLLTGLQEMGDAVEEPARLLGTAKVDVIAFGCTGGSFLNGPGYDQEIAEKISTAAGGVQTVVAARAVADALKKLGVRRIAVCTPYPEELNERLRSFYTAAGFDIVNFAYEDGGIPQDSVAEAREAALRMALGVDTPEAEAILISCTAFEGAGESIELIEDLTDKPVVTSNQATFWACLRALGMSEHIPGAGRLMSERVTA